MGQAADFVATHIGSDDLHGHAFTVNGEPVGLASTLRSLTWSFDNPGVYEVAVVVDNGVDQAWASVDVIVR